MRTILKRTVICFAILLLAGCELSSFSGSGFTIQWMPPVERVNGEKLLAYELGGYEIIYRELNTRVYQSITIEDAETSEWFIPTTGPGEYEVRVAAFDTNGLYSEFSNAAILKNQ